MDEKFPFSKTTGEINAFEGNTSSALILDPPLKHVLEDIWGRYELSCMVPPVISIGGITLFPDNSDMIESELGRNPLLLAELVKAIHNLIFGLAGKIYDSNWTEYGENGLIAIGVKKNPEFPLDYISLPFILSKIAFSKKTSLSVDERFRLSGIVRKGDEYASWAVHPGLPGKPFLYHRLANVVSSFGELKLSIENTGGNVALHNEVIAVAPSSWDGVRQSINPVRSYWTACSPQKILSQEQGSGYGKRVIIFDLVKDSEFGYFLSRTPSGRDKQFYMSTSSAGSEDSSETSEDSYEGPEGHLFRDDPNRYITAPTAVSKYAEVVPQEPVPVVDLDPEYRFPNTGEVPYRRPYHTAFTLNGNQIPILDRITDVTVLLKNGRNILEIEYFGRYAWSDWWILPAITVVESFIFRPRRSVSESSASSIFSSSSSSSFFSSSSSGYVPSSEPPPPSYSSAPPSASSMPSSASSMPSSVSSMPPSYSSVTPSYSSTPPFSG